MTVLSPFQKKDKVSFLIVRSDAIGDLVLSTPVLRTIKAWYPNSSTALLINGAYKDVVGEHSDIDQLLDSRNYKDLSIQQKSQVLKELKFDCVIFLQMEKNWIKAAKRANIPVRIGDKGNVILQRYLTHPVHQNFHNLSFHIIEQNLALLEPLKSSSDKFLKDLKINVSKKDVSKAKTCLKEQGWVDEPLVIIQPCTGGSDREWLPEQFTHLIRIFHHKTNYRVVLTGAGPREVSRIREITNGCQTKPYTLTDYGTLSELKGLLHIASAFIGTNTGPMHLAAALGKPTIALFPSKFQKPLQWGPWAVEHVIMRDTSKCPIICEPLSCQKDDCLITINPLEVFNALMSILGEAKSHELSNPRSLFSTKVGWFKQTATIMLYVSRDHDLAKATQTYRICQEQGLRVFLAARSKTLALAISQALRLSLRRIEVLSLKNSLKWIQLCAQRDVTVIHMNSIYNPSSMKFLRSMMALQMYVPPLVLVEKTTNPESLGDLSGYYLKKFEELQVR